MVLCAFDGALTKNNTKDLWSISDLPQKREGEKEENFNTVDSTDALKRILIQIQWSQV